MRRYYSIAELGRSGLFTEPAAAAAWACRALAQGW
jgi:hypothetical protein